MEVLTWLTFDKGENRQDIEQSEEHGQERTNTAYLFAVTFFMLSIDKIKYVFFKDSTRFAACLGVVYIRYQKIKENLNVSF